MMGSDNVRPDNVEIVVSQEGRKREQYVYALLLSLGAFLCGCAIFWQPPFASFKFNIQFENISLSTYLSILVSVQKTLRSIQDQFGWLTSWFLIGGIFGALPAGWMADQFGRRVTLIGSSIPWICSWVLLAAAENMYVLYVARFVCGVVTGIFSTVVPMYLTEIAENSVRGTLGTMFGLFLSLGYLFVTCVTDYHFFNYTCTVLTVFCTLSLFFVPESPVYLSRKDTHAAGEALKRLRGSTYNVHIELNSLRIQEEISPMPTFKASLISTGIMVGQKFCGIDYVVFSATSLFLKSGWSASTSAFVIGIVQTIATLASCILVEIVGRKYLLIASGVGMATSLILSTPFLSGLFNGLNVQMFLVIVFVVLYSVGFGPLPWMLPGELFPPRTRGLAFGAVVAANWMSGFLLYLFFAHVVKVIEKNLSVAVVYMLFAVVSATSAAFTFFFLPETAGNSIQQTQSMLLDKV